jgi:pimeloyl-ACP methyl ester carboxylesterase
MGRPLIYLPGLGGNVGVSPALAQLEGFDVVIPDVPGFHGEAGFEAPTEYLDWLVAVWDAVDETGATADGPVPIVGASVGGMLAAELAALRPEIVERLALIAPYGIADEANLGFDPFAERGPDRLQHYFAKGIPDAFTNRFAERGPEEQAVAVYLVDVATAALVWPIGDRGTAKRLPRITCPLLVLMGGQDVLIPPSVGELWGGATTIGGAGHLAEWDCPDEVAAELRTFLA